MSEAVGAGMNRAVSRSWLLLVLAHAPVLLPVVLRRPGPYRPLIWAPLLVLPAALLVRVVGDVTGTPLLVAVGGYGTVAALLLLPLSAVLTVALPAPARPGFAPVRPLVRS